MTIRRDVAAPTTALVRKGAVEAFATFRHLSANGGLEPRRGSAAIGGRNVMNVFGSTHAFVGKAMLLGAMRMLVERTTGDCSQAACPLRTATAQVSNPSPSQNDDRQIAEPAPVHAYSAALGANLARLSPFDTALGDRMGGVVPIGDVAEEKRAQVRRLWEIVLAPESRPKDDESVVWRELRWSQVRWEPQEPHGKCPMPPRADQYAARWMSSGSPIVVTSTQWDSNKLDSISVKINLSGDARVRCKNPQVEDLATDENPGHVLVKDIDKERLLAVLTVVFRFPWRSVDDFTVTWSPSPTSAGYMCIESAKPRKQDKQAQWFDEVGLRLERGDDRQEFSITVHRLDREPQ